jgi:hypothetical protein
VDAGSAQKMRHRQRIYGANAAAPAAAIGRCRLVAGIAG